MKRVVCILPGLLAACVVVLALLGSPCLNRTAMPVIDDIIALLDFS